MDNAKDTQTLNVVASNIGMRLAKYGIATAVRINDIDRSVFIPTKTIAARVMILYATFYAVLDINEVEKTKNWLRQEGLWPFLSPDEVLFYNEKLAVDKIDDFIWNMERAYILAWAINLVNSKPSPEELISDLLYEELTTNIPPLRTTGLEKFIGNRELRDPIEIYGEKIFNELIIKSKEDKDKSNGVNKGSIDFDIVKARYEELAWACHNCENRSNSIDTYTR